MASAAPLYFCGLARMHAERAAGGAARAPGESLSCLPVSASAGPSRPRIGLGRLLRWIHALRASAGTGARARAAGRSPGSAQRRVARCRRAGGGQVGTSGRGAGGGGWHGGARGPGGRVGVEAAVRVALPAPPARAWRARADPASAGGGARERARAAGGRRPGFVPCSARGAHAARGDGRGGTAALHRRRRAVDRPRLGAGAGVRRAAAARRGSGDAVRCA